MGSHGMNEIGAVARMILLDDITLNPELQPRANLDTALWQEYMFLLGDGVTLPPVVVFSEGDKLWLADGYHRWHAHKAIGDRNAIEAEVHQGSFADAMRYALGVNYAHGKRRDKADYRKAYQTALKHNLLANPADADGLQALLNCSTSWSYSLTAGARAEADEKKNSQIAAGKRDGKSNRQVARETGVSEPTVRRRQRAASRAHSTKATQPHPAQEALEKVTSPVANRWWGALRALEAINDVAPVELLMRERYDGGIDERFEAALHRAHSWINDFHRSYFNVD
jgi:hypothetical protein